MSKELYKRFTEIYLPGQQEIKNNDAFSESINKQIDDFVNKQKVSSYRIVNCETQAMPAAAFLKSDINKGYVMLIVHVAYSK
jgi:hypothetical protein